MRLIGSVLAGVAGWLLVGGPAHALSLAFDASQPGFPNPQTAVGTLEVDVSLEDLIASDTGGFLILLGAAAAGNVTQTDTSGAVASHTYSLDPRFATSTEELLLQVELLAGNPAMLRLVISDSAGWRSCILDPAACERRELFVSSPGGFGPGVATGITFDSDFPGHQVNVVVPEPASSWLVFGGMVGLALRPTARRR